MSDGEPLTSFEKLVVDNLKDLSAGQTKTNETLDIVKDKISTVGQKVAVMEPSLEKAWVKIDGLIEKHETCQIQMDEKLKPVNELNARKELWANAKTSFYMFLAGIGGAGAFWAGFGHYFTGGANQ